MKNIYLEKNGLVFIKLTRGKWAIINKEDMEHVGDYRWYTVKCACGLYYARTAGPRSNGKRGKSLSMHRVIIKTGKDIDHLNHNGLDNRRLNLIPCSHSENLRNRRINKNNISGVKGVIWYKPGNKWKAQIGINNTHISIGYFDTIDKAAEARRKVEIFYHWSRK